MHIVLLSGGSGKRLWPLSNEARSKQFLRLLQHEGGKTESMLQRVFRQIRENIPSAEVLVATGKSQVDPIRNQLCDMIDIVVEPERRNTFPAIMLAMSYLFSQKQLGRDEPIIVMPVDPCADVEYYAVIQQMAKLIENDISGIVLMGISPSFPTEKYGYIVPEGNPEIFCGIETYSARQFKEKPSVAEAAALISAGALWNGGVFGFKLGYIVDLLRMQFDDISYENVLSQYEELKKISFDYEVVEKASSVAMVKYEGKWKDLGTWNTLSEEMGVSAVGTVIMGEGTEGTTVINETDMPLVVLGAKALVVAASPDGILVADKSASSYLKKYVEGISNRPMFEERRWGEYKVIDYSQYDDGRRSLTKHMYMKANRSISYQLHHQRDEIWTIVHGMGEVTLNGRTRNVKPGDIIYISAEDKHSMKAITDLHFIEVQTGSVLEEDDIVRLTDIVEESLS